MSFCSLPGATLTILLMKTLPGADGVYVVVWAKAKLAKRQSDKAFKKFFIFFLIGSVERLRKKYAEVTYLAAQLFTNHRE